MIYPYIHVEYIGEVESINHELIEMYWTLENGNFFYRSINLEFRFNLTQPKIHKIISAHSKAILYLDYCSKCGSDIIFPINNKTECINLTKDESLRFICSKCKNSFRSEYNLLDDTDKCKFKLEFYYPLRLWEKLNIIEFDFLKYFLKINNYKKLIRSLTKEEFNEKWKMLEKFDRLGLIHISRNLNREMIDVNYLPFFREEIVGDVFIKENDVIINIPRKQNRTYDLQPHYAKKIVFNNPISINANTEYVCSVWHNADGSLDFKLVPLSQLQKKKNSINEGAIHVSELVSKVFKK